MICQPETLDISNKYNPFDLSFLRREGQKIFNGKFDVTDAPKKLKGVFDKYDTVKLTDYLVNRPLPKELLQWQHPPLVASDSADMENFYAEIIQHSIHGVWVDGEYFNPLFVYWLNIFVFPVYKLDKNGKPTEDFISTNPFYCTVDRYIFDVIWLAMLRGEDVSLMGGRGIGKSFIFTSIIDRNYRLFPETHTIVSSSNEVHTDGAWKKVDECMTAIEIRHSSLKHKRILGGNSSKLIESGEDIELPDRTMSKQGYRAKVAKAAYGKTPGKTRGERPNLQLIEEFAAFPPSTQLGDLKSCIRESKGSWRVMGIKKCTVLYSGTGGSVENDQAQDIFCNPKAYGMIATLDWEKPCGLFIPTHIKRAGTFEDVGCPDVATGEAQADKERLEAKSDPEAYMGLLQEFPKTLKEVFMRNGSNIFNQDKIARQRTALEFNGDGKLPTPEKGFLKWRRDELTHKILGVAWDPDPNGDIEIIEHPYWARATREEDKKVLENLYVGGCDSIDQGTGDSTYATDSKKGSELAVLIKKRILDNNYFKESSNIYVAKYKKRSVDVRDDWDNALKLSIYYNSLLNIEYTKIGIVSQFRARGFYHLLMKRPTIARGDADPTKTSNLVGTQASTPVIDHMDSKTKEYIDDYYDFIFFKDVLEQLQNYLREARTEFDLVIAMGLCELADEDKMGELVGKVERETESFEMFGYYTDSEGIKRYGVIPSNKDSDSKEAILSREAEAYRKSGGVRWIDMSDPDNPQLHFT